MVDWIRSSAKHHLFDQPLAALVRLRVHIDLVQLVDESSVAHPMTPNDKTEPQEAQGSVVVGRADSSRHRVGVAAGVGARAFASAVRD